MAGGTQYDDLASVYEFLVPAALLEPAGSYAAFTEWVADLRAGDAVLDCACGPGHLAVGLAQAGFTVTATDASPEMTSRASALAEAYGVTLSCAPVAWEDLGGRGWAGRFAAVLCVGNSLTHAQGPAARQRALRNMARVLRPGGRLVITSRNWERVRSAGSRLSIDDALVMRGGRRALVVRHWEIAEQWDERHRLVVAVAILDDRGGVRSAEQLDFWPFRSERLLEELEAAGLRVVRSTYAAGADRYLVAAVRD